MGAHKGFRVVRRGDRWRGFYRDGTRYASASWGTEAEAVAWASGKVVGKPDIALPAAAPQALTKDLATAYLKDLDWKRRAASHRQNVAGTLRRLGEAVPDLAVADAHRRVEEWLAGLRIERVGRHKRKVRVNPSPGYQNRVIAEVRAFCRWLIRKEYLTLDPSRTLERATVERKIKAQFSVAEVMQLCAPCADHPRQRRAALMLLAGLRSDEAAALTWADVQGGVIHVRRHAGHRLKRGRERIVPLQPALASILGTAGTGPVAPLKGVNSTVQHGRHFRLFLRSCGLPVAGRTPHSCRHTYGALMIATGCPSILVQGYMGHSSMATTADYARAAPLHVEAVKGWGMGVLLPADSP